MILLLQLLLLLRLFLTLKISRLSVAYKYKCRAVATHLLVGQLIWHHKQVDSGQTRSCAQVSNLHAFIGVSTLHEKHRDEKRAFLSLVKFDYRTLHFPAIHLFSISASS